MSVQAGIWNFDGKPVDPTLVAKFHESLRQQGPDGESSWSDGSVALLYRPFHTTAESRREKQPYTSRRGFVLTWDGRLDNREDLIAELRNCLDAQPTDVAIVAAGFDHWETACFGRLVGDFAVSLWRPKEHALFFGVDYMAVRHIFYYMKNDRIWWATDLAPLVLLSGDKFQIDEDYVAGYLANEPDARLTPYREIREVPPGHFVRVRPGGARIERFWRFHPSSRICYRTDAEYEEHFRHVFRQSVSRRLRSDSPVLAELSGGLDSSSIVCMADEIIAKGQVQAPRLDTISYYDNTEPNGDDWTYLQKVEEKRGRRGNHVDNSKLGRATAQLECSTFSALPGALGVGQKLGDERANLVLCGGYRTVLSGLGGDEFLGGIPDPRAQLADFIVRFRFIRLAKELVAWSLVKRVPWIRLLWQTAVGALPAFISQYFIQEAKVEPWILRDFAARTRLPARKLGLDEHFGLWLPSRRCYIGGVLLMASKLAKHVPPVSALEEARYPFLDRNLIEFILSIPASQLLRPGERRSLMRRSLAGIVPHEILSRRTKQLGSRTPILALETHWNELQRIFQVPISSSLGFVDETKLLTAICDARAGKSVPVVRLLWTISLEYWLRNLVARGLLDVPAHSSLPAQQRELPVGA